jgi:hypothetical protein
MAAAACSATPLDALSESPPIPVVVARQVRVVEVSPEPPSSAKVLETPQRRALVTLKQPLAREMLACEVETVDESTSDASRRV